MTQNAKKDILKFWNVHLLPKGWGQSNAQSESSHSATTSSSATNFAPQQQTAQRQRQPRQPRAAQKLSMGQKQAAINELKHEVEKNCPKCGLELTRKNLVFGVGNPDARIVIIAESPNFEEDRQGAAFAGKAGDLLTKIITAGMGIDRDEIYLAFGLKCRPPKNQPPKPDQINACSTFLKRQLKIIRPEVIIALEASTLRFLLPNITGETAQLRGQFYDYPLEPSTGETAKIITTYHPSVLLRDQSAKRAVWQDIQKVLTYLNIPLPTTKK
jgi:uracil-DNA glycosylase